MTSTTAFGVYDHNLVCAWERRGALPDALWRIRPKRIVVAAGAIERPLIVPDNDRPGVMSADAALVYLRRFAVLVGKRIAIATNNDSAYPVAEALSEAGAEVEIFDTRAEAPATKLRVSRGRRDRGRHRRRGRRRRQDRRANPSGRRAAAVRRLDADRASLRPGAGKAALRRRPRRAPAQHRGRRRRGRRRRQRRLHARRGVAAGSRGGRRRRRAAERAGRPVSDRRRLAEARCARPALDRLPERRDAEGRRARRPRRLCLGRASEALHHARHGDRPGQDLERQRPRRDGRADRPVDRGDRERPPTGRPSSPCRWASSPDGGAAR